MNSRFFTLAGGVLIGTLLTLTTLLSCQEFGSHGNASERGTVTADSQAAPTSADTSAAGISAQDLRDVLADMANSHNDKIKLAFWVSTLRPVDPPFRPFYSNMGTRNKELLAELQGWAKSHKVDLKYHMSNDLPGRAQKILEDRQEKLVRGDDKIAFEHDSLMQMYNDYEWNLSQIQALLPSVKDPELKGYLVKSEKMYSDGSAEIQGLLRRYKFE